MRLADKADLQNGLIKKVPVCVVTEQPTDVAYVIDGGAMLQRLPWPKSTSYANICQLYIKYTLHHFQKALIVFDGYHGEPSTKDEAHQRRSGHEVGVEVMYTPDMLIKMKKAILGKRTKQTEVHRSAGVGDGKGRRHSSKTLTRRC